VNQAADRILGMAALMKEEAGSEDEDLATRQHRAQLHTQDVLREFNLSTVESAPVIAAITAFFLLQFPPENREKAARDIQRYTELFLETEPAGIVRPHDA
jgi:hypothetical protein